MPRTRKFKKTFTNGKCVEKEAVINTCIYRLEFVNDKNIASFNETLTTLVYENTELLANFTKSIEDSRKDLCDNIIERGYKHDSSTMPGLQTTTNFKIALGKYQEAIVNKVRLCDVQIRYLQVGGQDKKDPHSRLCQAHVSLEQCLQR